MEHFSVSTSSHIKTLTPKSDTYVPYISCGEVLKTFSSTEQFVNNTSVCNDDEDDEKKAKS